MKIAIIHNKHTKAGGMETYLFDLISGFVADNDQITVLTCKTDKNILPQSYTLKKYFIPLPAMLRKYVFINYINRNFKPESYDLALSLTRTFNQDIVICGGTHKGYLKRLNKSKKLKDKLEIYFESKAYRCCQHIVAHSNLMKQELIDLYGISPEKITMLYPPLNTKTFNIKIRKNRDQYRHNFNISTNKTTLLFPSTGHARKGLPELLKAMQQLPADEFELLIAGTVPHDFQFGANIKCLGFVADMATLYAAVDLTILPAHYEPFGLVVAESLQCGTPVIISDQVGAKDLVTEKTGVILKTISPDVIVDAIYYAQKHKFSIEENFAEDNDLTLAAHIKKLKLVCKGGAGADNR